MLSSRIARVSMLSILLSARAINTLATMDQSIKSFGREYKELWPRVLRALAESIKMFFTTVRTYPREMYRNIPYYY